MKLLELLDIHGIQTFAAGDMFANQPIDLGWRCSLRQARVNHYGFAASLGREIAFVADPDDLAVQAQREENLGRGRKQRDNAHARVTLAQSRTTLIGSVALENAPDLQRNVHKLRAVGVV
jgi:hypothetical protein